jgi:hypothetical protein
LSLQDEAFLEEGRRPEYSFSGADFVS